MGINPKLNKEFSAGENERIKVPDLESGDRTNEQRENSVKEMFEEIKPEEFIDHYDSYIENLDIFSEESLKNDKLEGRLSLEEIDELGDEYNNEVAEKSSAGEVQPTDAGKWEKVPKEEYVERRGEFSKNKKEIIEEWERKNGQEWPKYEDDVCCTKNGENIRNKGDNYDAHHVQPLEFGGKNTADNITPMHTKEHTDKQGVHQHNSPYAQLADHYRKEDVEVNL